MVFHRFKWVPAVLGVAFALGSLPSTAKGACDSYGRIDNGTVTKVGAPAVGE